MRSRLLSPQNLGAWMHLIVANQCLEWPPIHTVFLPASRQLTDGGRVTSLVAVFNSDGECRSFDQIDQSV